MTSIDMITSLASMTSTGSLASKNQKLLTLYILSDFPGIRNLNSLNDLNSHNNRSGLDDLNSLFLSKNLGNLMFSSTLAPKWPILVWGMWNGSSKSHYSIDFWHSFCWRLWRPCMLLLTKSKDYMSNVHYSGFPKHLQTKSNLHISISQSKLKHKYLSLDTLYKELSSSHYSEVSF